MKKPYYAHACLWVICLLVLGNYTFAQAQELNIRGKITEADGSPLVGATVVIKGSPQGTITDVNGTYTLRASSQATLVFSLIGYTTQEVPVNGRTTIDISLTEDVTALQEVVVTALGIKREKRQLTYSTQEVKGDVVTATKEPNILNALTGRVAGVQITSSTGQPGSSSRIVIRGLSSISGNNEALIVLDGIPIINNETGNAGAGAGISRLSDIDPATIESVNVLKGAAASALYGSYAARGVLIITTKNGAAQTKPTVSFSSQYSIETPILPEQQSTYAQGENGQYYDGETRKTSSSWGPRMDTLRVNGQLLPKRDPLKDFFRNGRTLTNTLSVSGGTDKQNYLLSYSYLDQLGTVPNTDLKRHTLFTKFGTQITSKVQAVFQLNYTHSFANRMPEGYGLESPLWTLYSMPVSYNPLPYQNPDGTQRLFRFSRNNPYWVLDNILNTSRVNRFLPTITLTYTPFSWLTITERAGADMYAEQVKYYEAIGSESNRTGLIRDRNGNARQFNHDLIIEARPTIGPNWNLSLLVGNNLLSNYYQEYQEEGKGLSVTNFYNIRNASTQTYREDYYLNRKVGFYAQSNLEFKRMLNILLTGRYDGSSVLARDKSFYTYGSASAGFIFTELLGDRLPALTFGKLRASYSVVGNDNISPYALNTVYQQVEGFPFNGQNGFLIDATLGNPNLKNERTQETEVGLELRLFRDRINLETSYFYRKNIDLLTSAVPVAPSSGYTSTNLNAGTMENRGIEVLLTATALQQAKWRWDVSLVYTRIRNKILALNEGLDKLQTGFTYAFVGEPFGTFYNSAFKRTPDGQLLIGNDGLPLRADELAKTGNIQPDWLGSLTSTLRYGNIALTAFLDVRKGGDLYNSDERYGFFYGTPKVTENREDRVIAGVREADGQPNTIVVKAQNYYRRLNSIDESVIQDGTYVKLRNVSLSYTFSKDWLARTPFTQIQLSVTGRNLWIYAPNFTGADPEVSSYGTGSDSQGVYAFSVPTSRSVNFTLQATF